MKAKFFFAALLMVGASLMANGQGYKDGIEYYKVNRYDNAKELLERNLNASSTNKSEAYYYLGQIALHEGNTSAAASYFDKGIAANANDPLNYVGKGELALKSGAKADEFFKQARKFSKKDAKLEVEIARAYYRANPAKYDKDVKKCLKQAMKWNAQEPDISIMQADMYVDQSNYEDATGFYEWGFNYDPKNTEAYVKYAEAYSHLNPEYSIQRLEEGLQHNPNSALLQRCLADMYYDESRVNDAIRQYNVLVNNLNHFPQDEMRYMQMMLISGQNQEAVNYGESRVAALPASDPNVFYFHRMLLYSNVAMDAMEKGAAEGKILFSTTPTMGGSYTARDYSDYGKALIASGDTVGAINVYGQGTQKFKDNADLMEGLARAYQVSHRTEDAVNIYQQLVDKDIANDNSKFQLAVLNYRLASSATDVATRLDYAQKAKAAFDKLPEYVRTQEVAVDLLNSINNMISGN